VLLAKKHKIMVISNVESFHFVPSNLWGAVERCAERAA
jgi:hypothetical protein